MSPVIAIVGRPNVGKSALFNRMVGKRIAIVHDSPGVTRDRITAEAEWRGRRFTLIDTGGIGLVAGENAPDDMTRVALEQVDLAIESASVIIFVVDVREGMVPLDEEVAHRLRRCSKPVVLAVNKADTQKAEAGADDFAALGFETAFPVSAEHGRGMDPLLQAVTGQLAQSPEEESGRIDAGKSPEESDETRPFKLAIVGRPNVGKSSLLNALTRSDRVVVSPIPGTTRDAVDVPFEIITDGARRNYVLIDTAGLRKKRRVKDSIEFYSAHRAEDSIERCDLAMLVIDAEAGISEQDKKIAGLITANHKACLIVISKWDLVAPDLDKARRELNQSRRKKSGREKRDLPEVPASLEEFGQWVQRQLFFLNYAPVIFSSAKSGFHLDRLLEAVRYVEDQLKQKIPTPLINRALHEAFERRPPTSKTGGHLKFYYATQIHRAPPTFLLFVNRTDLYSDGYERFLAGELRKSFGFEGCPIRLIPRARPKKVGSIRRGARKKAAARSK